MGSIRFTPAIWFIFVLLAYVDAQLAFSMPDIPNTQAGDSITIAYSGTTYPVTFTLINQDTGISTSIGTSTKSPFTFTIPLDQKAAYYTIEGADDNGGDDSTYSFQIASAPANSPAGPGPATTSSTADQAGAAASTPTTAPSSTPPVPTTTSAAAVAPTATTPAAAATTSTPPAAVASIPTPTSSASTSTTATPIFPPTPPTAQPSNPISSSLPPGLTTPLPSSPTPGLTTPLTTTPTPFPQPFSPTNPPFPIVSGSGGGGGILNNNSTTYNRSNSTARSAMMTMPSASSSATFIKGLNSSSGERSQFWIEEHKECRGGCRGEAFIGGGARVRVVSGRGMVAVVGVAVVVVLGGVGG